MISHKTSVGWWGEQDLLIGEEFGIFFSHCVLMFPCSFIFGVITPLNLDKLDFALFQFLLMVINNTNRVFIISETRLEIKKFHINGFGRNTKTFLQLRYVKDMCTARDGGRAN